MSFYENALAENAGVPKNELRKNLEQREPEFMREMIKSLNCLIDQSQSIQRNAKKISGESSTKLFIKSFLFNIKEIKTGYKPIESYFKAPAESHNISVEKNKNDNPLINNDLGEEDGGDEENEIENIPEIMDIKSELEKIAVEIISKSEDVKSYLRNMNGINNADSFTAGAYNSFRDLNDAILKLDSIEEMIMAYSK